MAKNIFGNCWECLSAGKKLIICIMWCVCVCVCGVLIYFVSLVSAASHSQKGSHRDRREMIVYEEGLFD
jgi:flagellar basal body-associated protein FliL